MNADVLSVVIVAEGSSDSALESPVRWLINYLEIDRPLEIQISFRSQDSGTGLPGKLQTACQLFEPDLVLLHRDSDGTSYEKRLEEIEAAAQAVDTVPVVPVIPIRMTEAWLLIDEQAIRRASGNPQGKTQLELPKIGNLETIADPKSLLFDLLRKASELKGRRLKKFSVFEARKILAEEIEDFSALLQLSAFQKLLDLLRKQFQGRA